MVDYGSDVTILKNSNFAGNSLDGDVDHGMNQIAGSDISDPF